MPRRSGNGVDDYAHWAAHRATGSPVASCSSNSPMVQPEASATKFVMISVQVGSAMVTG